jgi:hypothetical protein
MGGNIREDENLCIKWKDNKCVTLLPSCIGSEPVGTCTDGASKKRKKVDVPRSPIVHAYNRSMGGIDLCDRLLAYYRSSI